MKKASRQFLTVLVILLLVISAGCSKNTSKSSAPARPATINAGSIEGATYKNDYLGLTMQIPENWQVQNKEFMEEMTKKGQDMIAGDDANMKAAMNAAKSNVVQLLTMSKYPMGTPDKSNILFTSAAEKVSLYPGVKNGKDYLVHVKKLLEKSQVNYAFPKDSYSQSIDGVDFSVLETTMQMQGITVYQTIYATIIGDYAYNFSLTYTSPEELAVLQEIVATMKFVK